jgi:nicotinamidase-related amidase
MHVFVIIKIEVIVMKCIVVVDMQNDFVTGSLGNSNNYVVAQRIASKLQKEQCDLFFTQDTHYSDYLQTQEGKNLPIEHCIKYTQEKHSWGWEICDVLKKFTKNAVMIEKNSFGSLELPDLVKCYDEVELVGVCTDICVVSNALLLKANNPEQLITVDLKCCGGTTKENHEAALLVMKSCQINIK